MAEDYEDPHDQDIFAPVPVQTFKYVHVDTAQGISRITLNRPPANVLSVELMHELGAAVESLEYQKDVKLVLLFGAGRYFSAGFELADHLGDRAYMMLEAFRRVALSVTKYWLYWKKPSRLLRPQSRWKSRDTISIPRRPAMLPGPARCR